MSSVRSSTGSSAAIVAIAYLLQHSREPFTIAQMLDPGRTVAELRELQELTGDENGAQRVAWTDTWQRAREWLGGKLDGTGAEETVDAAGNQWFTLPGESERALLIGGHIDSVPNGGWLDGALNVMAGVEVLRRIAGEGKPAVTIRLVNSAGEDGGRCGRSLRGAPRATRWRGRRSWSSRSGRSLCGPGRARSARWAASSRGRGSSPRSSRPPSACSTSGTSTRRSSRRCFRTPRRHRAGSRRRSRSTSS